MAEIIKKNAVRSGDKEEEPIIVAQRFLNIFHQLHVFDDDRRNDYNKMLVELPESVKSAFRQLPGGSVLLEYLDEIEGIEQEADGNEDLPSQVNTSENTVVAPAVQNVSNGGFLLNTSEFAKVLANTLAQSNAQIVRELQKNLQTISSKTHDILPQSKVTLETDDNFTQSIAEALSKAISTSEQKRQEDTKIIANSFLELQENLAKMIEQNAQLKVVADGKVSKEGISALGFKNIIDDLVKSQTKFLKETSQSQKEELASIVSSAIKESIKLSTQSLADTFRQLYNEPTPITYASPEQKKQNISELEDIIKAQGREFSSIIAGALRESQKNSTQNIIKTIEGLKAQTIDSTGQKTDDILKEQMKLFREITREQNKEFSLLITNALKEGQKQSAAIIGDLVKNLQNQNSVKSDVLSYSPTTFYPRSAVVDSAEEKTTEPVFSQNEQVSSKKKKKKKKNVINNFDTKIEDNISPDPVIYSHASEDDLVIDENNFSVVSDDKPKSVAEEWGFISSDDDIKESVGNSTEQNATDSNEANDNNVSDVVEFINDSSSVTEKPENITDENSTKNLSDNQIANNVQDDTLDGEEGKDWEWAYEEIDDNWEAGEEGKDWEWEYEEIEDPDIEISNIVERSQITFPDDFKLVLKGFDFDNYEDPYCENVDDMY